MSAQKENAPLTGIKVIEVGQMITVPAATHILASYGAEIIKVEDTAAGDPLRFYGSVKNGMSGWFANANGGKRSIALDLKSDAGKDILWRLIEEADVFLEGFRNGVIDRLGFSYDQVKERNAKIVFCSSSGFGPVGPYADQPVYDPLIQALTGWAGIQKKDGEPALVRGMVADKVGANTNAQAIMAALIKRERTGRGSHVQVNMLEASLNFVWSDVMMDCTLLDEDADHRPNVLGIYRLHKCKDGWISIAVGADHQWKAMCHALDRPDIFADERLVTSAGRGANQAHWYDMMDEMVAPLTIEVVVERLREADVPVAPVLEPKDVFKDPQVAAAGFLKETDHPIVGKLRHPRGPAAYLGVDHDLAPAPTHGQHTSEILGELGFGEDDIEAMIDASTVLETKPA